MKYSWHSWRLGFGSKDGSDLHLYKLKVCFFNKVHLLWSALDHHYVKKCRMTCYLRKFVSFALLRAPPCICGAETGPLHGLLSVYSALNESKQLPLWLWGLPGALQMFGTNLNGFNLGMSVLKYSRLRMNTTYETSVPVTQSRRLRSDLPRMYVGRAWDFPLWSWLLSFALCMFSEHSQASRKV